MEIHLKVKKARIDAGMSQTDFAKKIGTSQNDVWRMENGDKKFVSRAYIDFMLEEGYDLNTLFDHNLPLQKIDQQETSKPNKNNDTEEGKIDDKNYVAIYNGNILDDFTHFLDNQKDFTPIDNLYLPNVPKNDGAICVQCDSMDPTLKKKDIIIFSKYPVDLENILYGEIYLISLKLGHHELIVLKRFKYADRDGKCIKLISDNPKYQSMDVPIEKIQAMALVKGSVSFNSGIAFIS